jgi:hypothetical protein
MRSMSILEEMLEMLATTVQVELNVAFSSAWTVVAKIPSISSIEILLMKQSM